MAYTAHGKSFANIGEALRAAHWGEFGNNRTVTLKRDGYFDTVIAKGGPRGWYVRDMGDKKPQPRTAPAKPTSNDQYVVSHGRCVKVK
jgi:hypothetical protein